MADPAAILDALGVSNVSAITPVAGGTDTALWRVRHAGSDSALRVFRAGHDASFRREQEALRLAHKAGLPVPEVRAVGRWHDQPVALLRWCRGEPLATVLPREPWRLIGLAWRFGQMQARMHQIGADAMPATDDWVGWYGAADATLAAALRCVAQPETRLLHLDYHLRNVLADRGRITAVLDWANARPGDPRADVARTVTILLIEPHQPDGDPLWYRVVRLVLARSYLAGYQRTAGPLRDMPLFYTWAGAVMQRDLAPRVHDTESWWQPRHMERVARWTNRWRDRARPADCQQSTNR